MLAALTKFYSGRAWAAGDTRSRAWGCMETSSLAVSLTDDSDANNSPSHEYDSPLPEISGWEYDCKT